MVVILDRFDRVMQTTIYCCNFVPISRRRHNNGIARVQSAGLKNRNLSFTQQKERTLYLLWFLF